MSFRIAIVACVVCALLMLGGSALRAAESSPAELIAALKTADAPARLKTIDQLGALGDKAATAVAPLTELLKDKSPTVRLHAAHSLGQIGSAAKSAVPALGELLKDPDAVIRRHAVKAVMAIKPGPQVTVPMCVKLLEDSDPGVRVRMLSTIAEAGAPAVPGIIVALKNDQAAYWACLILREMGPAGKDAIPALIERLSDPRPEVRREALLALAGMEKAAAPAVAKIAPLLKDEHASTAATFALARIGSLPSDVDETIRANSKSDDTMLATVSLWALAHLHPDDKTLQKAAAEMLISRLSDEDPFTRVAAARALAALPPAPEITLPIFEKAFKSGNETTVQYALDALARLGAPAVPKLVEALKHGKLRPQIIQVLRQIGPAAAPATDALAALVDDPDEEVSRGAIMALATIGPGAKGAVETLVKSLKQPEGQNAHAIVYALGSIGPGAAAAQPALVELMNGSNQDLALISAWAAIKVQPQSKEATAKAIAALTTGLSAPSPLMRRGAAETLGQIGPPAKAAAAALQAAAKDSDKSVRDAATQALTSIRG